MTNLTELKKLAEAARESGRKIEIHLGYDGSRAGTYVVQLQNQQLLQMIALLEQMAEALERITSCHVEQGLSMQQHATHALAAYKELTK